MPSILDNFSRFLESEKDMVELGLISQLDHVCWAPTVGVDNPSALKALVAVRRQVLGAVKRSWSIIQSEGKWRDMGRLFVALLDLAKLHAAVYLKVCHVVNVIPLQGTRERLHAFIGPAIRATS